MQELLDHIAARFPEVAMGCREFAARWLADEAALLEPNHVLVRSRDDILPGLARAIRARDVELSEVARRCGLEARDLRVTVALSRLGELLNPGDIANLSDQELDSKLRQAAREFGLHADELLQEIGNPPSVILRNSPLGTSIGNPAIGRRRRCWACSRLRPQCYKVDFNRNAWEKPGGEHPGPVYACARCLPGYLVSPEVQQITRLKPADIPNSSGPRLRSAAFVAVLILVCSALYARAKGTIQYTSKLGVRPTSATAPLPKASSDYNGAMIKSAAARNDSTDRSASSAAVAAPGLDSVPFSTQIVSDTTIVSAPQVSSASRASYAVIDGNRQSAWYSMSAPSRTAADTSQAQPSKPSPKAKALDQCREVLHSERPLLRYSVRDTMKEADASAIAAADACTRRLNTLKDLGSACSDSFRWFEVFQTTLLNHVKRVCRQTSWQADGD